MKIEIEHAVPERDAPHISELIDVCRSERRTVLNSFSPEEERAYIEELGPGRRPSSRGWTGSSRASLVWPPGEGTARG